MTLHSFTCGHTGEEPRYMGRGQARVKRLARHFAVKCPICTEQALRKLAETLQVIIGKNEVTGKFITRFYNIEEQKAWLAKKGIY